MYSKAEKFTYTTLLHSVYEVKYKTRKHLAKATIISAYILY
jgi:hypothetical protein